MGVDFLTALKAWVERSIELAILNSQITLGVQPTLCVSAAVEQAWQDLEAGWRQAREEWE